MATAKTEFDENAMKFRERFIEERKKKGYTQQSLAEKLNVSSFTFNGYEAKGALPSFDMIIKICKEFNLTSDYLLGLSDQNFFSALGVTYVDKVSEGNFVNMVRILNQRDQLDFYIDKDKNGNNCITFKVMDSNLTEQLMGLIGLKVCKQMMDEAHFANAVEDIIRFGNGKKLINGKPLLNDNKDWNKEHYTIDELRYYKEYWAAEDEEW